MIELRRAVRAGAAVAGAATVGVVAVFWFFAASAPTDVQLRFRATFAGEPLLFDQVRYANPGGPGQFAVRDFRLFVSNVSLYGAGGAAVYTQPDSYHLLRFDADTALATVTLSAVPQAAYHTLVFGVGVDPAANGGIELRGDLDPNSRMAWSWDVGYKFVLFEGQLHGAEGHQPLVYHVGFDSSYQPVELPLDDTSAGIDLSVDVQRLFDGRAQIDMAALPSVKFDPADAARMASNFARLITVAGRGAH